MDGSIQNLGTDFLKSESGATAIEYGLLIAMISLVLIFVLQNIGNTFSFLLNSINNTLTT